MKREFIKTPSNQVSFGFSVGYSELVSAVSGVFILEMKDATTGEILAQIEKKNVITRDTSILAARLFKDHTEPVNGVNMLAVGTGALGAILSPDAPDARQRKLNAEISRKTFANVVFRTSAGAVSSVPTNIVDFVTTFSEAEAVGVLNEMGLLSTKSNLTTEQNYITPYTFPTYDTTVDMTQFDTLVNYITFAPISKPSTAVLTITWRLTF